MQSSFPNNQNLLNSEISTNDENFLSETDINTEKVEDFTGEAFLFETHFQGYMEMYSEAKNVAEYLDAHEGWFCRCAEPMKVESLGNNSYTLTIGNFGGFGYQVEPKISVILHPPQGKLYLMNSIPTPNYIPQGYDVNYQAWLELLEVPADEKLLIKSVFKNNPQQLPKVITKVNWQLHMIVKVKFPKFVYKLAPSLVLSAGDKLLSQIVRQISPQLTYKVQKDFHSRLDLPIPNKSSRSLQRISQVDENGY